MPKKTIQSTATTIQKVEVNLGTEKISLCSICKTICDSNEFNKSNKMCIFCAKKIQQFKNIKVFTFKPCIYYFYKTGVSKNELEALEWEQMKMGIVKDFFEYNIHNMVWYIYKDVDPDIIFKNVSELFFLYKNINQSSKNHINNTIDKFKYMFLTKQKHISVQMIVSDFSNSNLNFSSFLPRERLFI